MMGPEVRMFDKILKKNPYHDEKGRFTTPEGSSGGGGGVAGSAANLAASYKSQYKGSTHDVANQIIDEVFTPKERKIFEAHLTEIADAVAAGQETHLIHSKNGDGTGGYTDERTMLHQELLGQTFKNVDHALPGKGEKPTFTLLGGRGGSGKSAFDRQNNPKSDFGVYDSKKSIVLNTDHFKELLAKRDGYPGIEHRAYLYHEESSHLFKTAMRVAKARGVNVVADITMNSDKSDVIKDFKKAGYRTEAHYMFLPPEKAVKRALERYKRGGSKGRLMSGRLVVPEVVLGMTKNESHFDNMRKLVDNSSLWSNDVPFGEKPKKITKTEKAVAGIDDFLYNAMGGAKRVVVKVPRRRTMHL